jgi:hypothetical protein
MQATLIFGKTIAAYAKATVTLPEGADITTFLKENGERLSDDLVFDPDWTTEEGLRVVHAQHNGEILAEDIALEEPGSFENGEMARTVIRKHWDTLASLLPPETLSELAPLKMERSPSLPLNPDSAE